MVRLDTLGKQYVVKWERKVVEWDFGVAALFGASGYDFF